MLVSVIIPTYRRHDLLIRAVESVLRQSYSGFEIIVVDDDRSEEASKTREILENLNDTRIRYLKNNREKGANGARNTGILHAHGEWIAFLDDDDAYLPDNLKERVAYLKSCNFEDTLVIYSDYEIVGPMPRAKDHWANHETGEVFIGDPLKIFEGNYVGPTSLIMASKSKLTEAGLFDETLPSCQDWDMYIRLTMGGNKLVGLTKRLFCYYSEVNIPRITSNINSKKNGLYAIMNKFSVQIASLSESRKMAFHSYLYRRLCDVSLQTGYTFFFKYMLPLYRVNYTGRYLFELALPVAKKIPFMGTIYRSI